MKNTNFPLSAAAGTFITILALLLAGCDTNNTATTEDRRPVRWSLATEEDQTSHRSFVGRTRSGSEARVSPKIAGTIQEILVDVGDDVQVGDVIARIDPESLQLQRDAAASGLTGARSQANAARSTYNRIRTLYEQELASRQDYDAARATAESAEAAVAGAERQLELAELQLSYTTVSSPFSGRVSARLVNAGENIAAGHPVVLLVSQDRWEVTLSVPDVVVGSISTGDPAEIRVSAFADSPLTGSISGVGGGTSLGVGSYPVTVRIHQNPRWMRAGMIARVEFPRVAQPIDMAVRVPTSAVAEDRDGHYLYVIDADEGEVTNGGVTGQLRRTPVTVGRLLQDQIEIAEGIPAGTRVVTLGLNHLTDGMPVLVLPEMQGDNREHY